MRRMNVVDKPESPVLIIDDWNLHELTEEQSQKIESLKYRLVYGGQIYVPAKYFLSDDRVDIKYTCFDIKDGTTIRGFVLDYERYHSMAGSGMIEETSYSWTVQEAEE